MEFLHPWAEGVGAHIRVSTTFKAFWCSQGHDRIHGLYNNPTADIDITSPFKYREHKTTAMYYINDISSVLVSALMLMFVSFLQATALVFSQ